MDNVKCRNSECETGLPVNASTWPGDIGFCSGTCYGIHAYNVEAAEESRLLRERQAFAAHLRSPEFLTRSLGLTLGETP